MSGAATAVAAGWLSPELAAAGAHSWKVYRVASYWNRPTRFLASIRSIGDHEEHFVGRVLAVVKLHLAEGTEPAFSSRVSAGGRHICVTIEPELEHAGQVLEIYGQLRELAGLRMLM